MPRNLPYILFGVNFGQLHVRDGRLVDLTGPGDPASLNSSVTKSGFCAAGVMRNTPARSLRASMPGRQEGRRCTGPLHRATAREVAMPLAHEQPPHDDLVVSIDADADPVL